MKKVQVLNKAFKFRLFPNEEQKILFNKTFGCTRFIWNKVLADSNEHYKEYGKMKMNLPTHYKDVYPFLKEVDSLALCSTWMDLKQAFNNHFKKPDHYGLPNFKSKHHCKRSYTTNVVNNNIDVLDDCIKLPKVGLVKMKQHRELPTHAVLKRTIISQTKTGKYFVSLLFEYENQVEEREDTSKSLGLDMKLNGLYMDSNGHSPEMPRFYRRAEKRLAEQQAKLSKLYVKGRQVQSKRYYKQKVRVAKLHEKIHNRRIDFLHKESLHLVQEYDYIFIEDLNVKEMAQDETHKLGKSVSDISWSVFVSMLSYKAEMYGSHTIKIDKWYPSSQICSACGSSTGKKELGIDKWTCPECGAHHDRDHNAAKNIKNEGMRRILSGTV